MLAPIAESVVGFPAHTVGLFAEAVTVGSGFTVTFFVEVDEQEFASITVSEYVPPLVTVMD